MKDKNGVSVKVGDVVKVVGNTCSHNYPVGSLVTIKSIVGGGTCGGACAGEVITNGFCGNNLYAADIELTAMTKKEINSKIKQLEGEISHLKGRLEFMKEIGSDEYDEVEFKTYQVLKEMENPKTTIIDKAKAIAKLIKSN